MEELEGSAVLESKYWQQEDFGEELMSELLDETAPQPPVYADSKEEEEGPRRRRESMMNKLISTVYSGPTISDIESALSFTGGDQLAVDARKYSSSPVVFSPDKVLSKMENKYTLKIKTCGNGLAEDGYKWRKYGQKSIKNSPNPRSYYRCTNPRCNAKKQVERATDEPDTLLVTYEGLHLHYTYSHFLHQHQQQGLPKKPKRDHLDGPAHDISPLAAMGAAAAGEVSSASAGGEVAAAASLGLGTDHPAACYLDEEEDGSAMFQGFVLQHEEQMSSSRGLLEDVVPLLVRRPCFSPGATTTTSTSSPPPPSPSASWTPTSPYIDMAILSNIF